VKSPVSMKNGTINTSKCRGKLQKMEELYTHSPKSPGPFPQTSKKINFKNKKISKKKGLPGLSRCRPAADKQPLVAAQPWAEARQPFFLNLFFFCPPLFVQVVNSCWLAPSHACPGQTLPKNFKQP
jgi:hypothetical protein